MKRLLLLLALIAPALVRADDSAGLKGDFDITLPAGIPSEVWSYFIPKDNPLTTSKVRLGRELFFDKRLSADGAISCATCHDPRMAFADGRKVAEGISGRRGSRNTPTLLNAMFNSGQFWDGRASSLEEQARMPLVNPDEMGNESFDQVVRRIESVPEYKRQFQEIFGGQVSIDSLARAIAAFERTLVSGNSPLDRYLGGDRNALGAAALRGLALFRGKARCGVCHTFNQSSPFFSDQNYRSTGVAANSAAFDPLTRRAAELARASLAPSDLSALARQEGAAELGRFLITGNQLDIGAFRTPSLRNVELTAPYFHDGSARTLADVVRFYIKGGNEHPRKDWELQPLDLSDNEQNDLIEFLKSLTSDETRRMAAGSPD